MDTPPKTLTYTTTLASSSGRERRVSISLPFITAISDDPHYQPPPPAPKLYPAERREPAMTTKRIRRALGKDRAYSEALHDRIKYEATVNRILRGQVR
jgi:hypothetical protein